MGTDTGTGTGMGTGIGTGMGMDTDRIGLGKPMSSMPASALENERPEFANFAHMSPFERDGLMCAESANSARSLSRAEGILPARPGHENIPDISLLRFRDSLRSRSGPHGVCMFTFRPR